VYEGVCARAKPPALRVVPSYTLATAHQGYLLGYPFCRNFWACCVVDWLHACRTAWVRHTCLLCSTLQHTHILRVFRRVCQPHWRCRDGGWV